MKKKKLQLHRSTIAHLTAQALANVAGGEKNAGVQSIRVDTRIEPCQRPSCVDDGGNVDPASC